jgi:hypothetical protein
MRWGVHEPAPVCVGLQQAAVVQLLLKLAWRHVIEWIACTGSFSGPKHNNVALCMLEVLGSSCGSINLLGCLAFVTMATCTTIVV